MAHKKGAGSTNNGRDSISKRLGVKIFGGQYAFAGNIIIRQRGTKFHPGKHMGMGKDHTLFALTDGEVVFKTGRKDRTYVSINPDENYIAAMEAKRQDQKAKAAANAKHLGLDQAGEAAPQSKAPSKKEAPAKKEQNQEEE